MAKDLAVCSNQRFLHFYLLIFIFSILYLYIIRSGHVLCGGLNVVSPLCLRHLNVSFPVLGSAWVWLGGVTLLEELSHWGWALRRQKLLSFPTSSLCFLSAVQAICS